MNCPPFPGAISGKTRDIAVALRKWFVQYDKPCYVPWKPVNDTEERWLRVLQNWFTIEKVYAPVSKESFGTKVLYWKFSLHDVPSGKADSKAE